MIASLIRWSTVNRPLVLLVDAARGRLGHLFGASHAARRDPGSVRRAGHRQDRVPGPGAAGHGGSGDLSADERHAGRARRGARARLFVFRRIVCLRDFRGRHRSLLGAHARARISEPGARTVAAGRTHAARPGCQRRGLDLPVRARRSHRPARSRGTAQPPGLVSQVRVADRARCGRGRQPRRHGQAIPGGARPRTHARPFAVIVDDPPDDSRRQSGGERLGHRDGRGGVSDPRQGLHQEPGRISARIPYLGAPRGRGRAAAAGYRRHPHRSADASRHRRSGRPGRGRGRHRRHALGRQCPDHHRTGQGQDWRS